MNKLATFERSSVANEFENTSGEWGELCKAFVNLEPLTGREFLEAAQIQTRMTHRGRLIYTAQTAQIKSKDRFKIALPTLVEPEEPDKDINFRIFQIESIVNVREQNQELELMAVESG